MGKNNGKINLLVDGHFLSGIKQGSRTYIIGLYTALIDQYGDYYNVFVSGHKKADVLDNLNIPEENFIPYKSDSNLRRLTIELPKIISNHNIDFAHFQQIAPAYKNCKFITTVHDVLFNDYPEQFSMLFRLSRNFLFNRSISKSEIKLTVSDYSKSKISSYFNIAENQIHVTLNGVREKYFSEYSKRSVLDNLVQKFGMKRYVLFVSRLEPRKNHATLLKAFLDSELPDNHVDLVFVGKRTSNYGSLDKLINSLSPELKKHVHHFENLNDEELLTFYQGAELFVYPSYAEGFGIPPLEAAACKVPVICSNTTAMTDFEKLGITMFDPHNHVELKNNLNLLVVNKNEQNAEGLDKISKMIKNQYSWSNSASILHRLIQRSKE